MGILETINAKLNLVMVALKIDAAQLESVVSEFEVAKSAPVVPTSTVTVIESIDVPHADTVALPVDRISLKEAVEKGLVITGNELDENGCYWSKDINTEKPAYTQKFVWKKGRGVDEAAYDAGVAKIKAAVAAEKATLVASGVVESAPVVPAAPAAAVPAVPGLPAVPGVPAVPGLPAVPGIPNNNMTSETESLRKECLQLINTLTKKYGVDIEVINTLLATHGSNNGKFDGLPDSSYPFVSKKLNAWMIGLDHIEQASTAILGMVSGDKQYVTGCYNTANVGTTEPGLVHFADLRKLYVTLHSYQNVLENHFKRVPSGIEPDPFV